ncbi:MAG: glutamyl-tRNA reductase, partial [Thermodesulfobacteriota bacterium]
AELAARHLLSSGVREIMITNRTYEKAVNLARDFSGTAIMLREFPHFIKDADIVIASTAAPKFIIKPDMIKEVLKERRHKPMFFIDISVPRNIDPSVNNLDGAYVYDVDDLQGVVDANLKERSKEAGEAEEIVVEEIGNFYRWVKALNVVPTIIALRQMCDEIRKGEIEKALPQLSSISEEDKEVLEAMTSSIINKVLHHPVTHLKREANNVESDFNIEAARKLFDLDEALEKLTRAKGSEE